jgi:hypothetical protein
MISEFDPRDDSQTSPFTDPKKKKTNAAAGALGQEQPYVEPAYVPTPQGGVEQRVQVGATPALTGVVNPDDPLVTQPAPSPSPTARTQNDMPDPSTGAGNIAGDTTAKATTGLTTDPYASYKATPAGAAVLSAFQTKGLQPRDQADLQYWVDKIAQTGGWDNPGNQSYWTQRMAQGQGGVGDYLERPEAGKGGTGYSAGLMNALAQALGGNTPTLDTYETMLARILQNLSASGALNNNPFGGGQ